jgi:peroxiredoxin
MSDELTKLPNDLPIPENDGKANSLLGRTIPSIILPSTKDSFLDLSIINKQYGILYFFPSMNMPGKSLPSGWNDIPGARGCTPQNISFSTNNTSLEKFDAVLIGISSQPIYELEQLSSLRKFSQTLVSDSKLEFQRKLGLPTFTIENKTMYKRLTLIVKNSKIIKIFYPIFPPDKHVFEILDWLKKNSVS